MRLRILCIYCRERCHYDEEASQGENDRNKIWSFFFFQFAGKASLLSSEGWLRWVGNRSIDCQELACHYFSWECFSTCVPFFCTYFYDFPEAVVKISGFSPTSRLRAEMPTGEAGNSRDEWSRGWWPEGLGLFLSGWEMSGGSGTKWCQS